jgi:hypothetical protein
VEVLSTNALILIPGLEPGFFLCAGRRRGQASMLATIPQDQDVAALPDLDHAAGALQPIDL